MRLHWLKWRCGSSFHSHPSRSLSPSQTPTCCGTSSWQRWRWARVDSGNERAAKRPRANPRPFHPPDPSTFDPASSPYIRPPSLHLLYRLLTAAQPTDRRDRRSRPGDISNAVCDPTSFSFPSLFFSPSSPSGAVVPLPRCRQSSKHEKNNKKQGNAVLYSYETVDVVEWKRSFKTYIWIMDICVI